MDITVPTITIPSREWGFINIYGTIQLVPTISWNLRCRRQQKAFLPKAENILVLLSYSSFPTSSIFRCWLRGHHQGQGKEGSLGKERGWAGWKPAMKKSCFGRFYFALSFLFQADVAYRDAGPHWGGTPGPGEGLQDSSDLGACSRGEPL